VDVQISRQHNVRAWRAHSSDLVHGKEQVERLPADDPGYLYLLKPPSVEQLAGVNVSNQWPNLLRKRFEKARLILRREQDVKLMCFSEASQRGKHFANVGNPSTFTRRERVYKDLQLAIPAGLARGAERMPLIRRRKCSKVK